MSKTLDVPEDIQFAQIMRLMTSKHTSGLPERHSLAVKKVRTQVVYGVL